MRHEIHTPIPGVFYRRPDPEAEPFVAAGDAVQVDQTIGLVEIMKSFTEIRSDAAGRLVEIVVDDEDAVVSGQVVAILDDGA